MALGVSAMGSDSARRQASAQALGAATAKASSRASLPTQAASEAPSAVGLQTVPRGRGRGGGRGNVGRGKRSRDAADQPGCETRAKATEKPRETRAQSAPPGEASAKNNGLSQNISGMRFMQSAMDEQKLRSLGQLSATLIVTLDKVEGSLLGITYDQRPDAKPAALALKSISQGGLVSAWNKTSEKKVEVKDQIIEVNGLSGDLEKMLAELRRNKQFVLKFRKPLSALAQVSKVKAAAEAKRAREQSSGDIKPPESVRLHRRSYKGANPLVETWMKEELRKANEALEVFKDHEEASAFRGMKQRRVGR